MKIFRMIKRSIRDAFKSIIRNFSLSFASIICTTITLILVAVAIVAAANIRNTTKNIESELSIVAYLKQDSTEETIANVTADIKSNENVEFIEVKTKDEWKLEMEKYSDSFDRALNYLDTNPLLDSFVVKVKDVKKLKEVAKFIDEIEAVETVKYGENMVENIVSVFNIVEKIVVGIVIALIIVTGFLISNTIRLTIFSRRNEIEIMRLVGASNIYIKFPFVIEGLLIGIIGSIIPICITIYGYVIAYTELGGKILNNINMLVLIKPYNFVFQVSLVLLIIGALVGMYGSLKAVRKYLKI